MTLDFNGWELGVLFLVLGMFTKPGGPGEHRWLLVSFFFYLSPFSFPSARKGHPALLVGIGDAGSVCVRAMAVSVGALWVLLFLEGMVVFLAFFSFYPDCGVGGSERI